MNKIQNFENHSKVVPGFHQIALPIFLVNLIWCVYHAIRQFSGDHVIALLLAIAFILLSLYARNFALTVQDRVIRLEMQLRLQQVLPEDLGGRISEFEVGQLVALRFASDEELPELARKVLNEKLTDRKTIKRMIKSWQADFLRA